MSDWFNPANDGEAQVLAIGEKREREAIIKRLNDYLELTLWSEQVEKAEPNPDWTNGFQAALALVRSMDNKAKCGPACHCDDQCGGDY